MQQFSGELLTDTASVSVTYATGIALPGYAYFKASSTQNETIMF